MKEYQVKVSKDDEIVMELETDERKLARAMLQLGSENGYTVETTHIAKPKNVKFAGLDTTEKTASTPTAHTAKK